MVRYLLRTLIILLVAGILAGGLYSFANTSLVESMVPVPPEVRPEAAGDTVATVSNGELNQPAGEEDSFDHRPLEDLSIWFRLSGLLGHTIIIAIIITVVTYGQKLMGWIALKVPENLRAFARVRH